MPPPRQRMEVRRERTQLHYPLRCARSLRPRIPGRGTWKPDALTRFVTSLRCATPAAATSPTAPTRALAPNWVLTRPVASRAPPGLRSPRHRRAREPSTASAIDLSYALTALREGRFSSALEQSLAIGRPRGRRTSFTFTAHPPSPYLQEIPVATKRIYAPARAHRVLDARRCRAPGRLVHPR